MSETANPPAPAAPAAVPPAPPAPAPEASAAPANAVDLFGPDVPQLSDERLPPNFRKHVDPKAPVPLRGMAAKGLVPMNPADMCHALAMLAKDADAGIAATALKTAAGLPERILTGALRDEGLSPRVLDFFATALDGKPAFLELIALNNATHDLTVARLAQVNNVKLLEIISNNQLRLLREEKVLKNLITNPVASKALVDSVCDFAVRSGVVMLDVPAMVDAHIRIHGKAPVDPNAPVPAATPEAQPEVATAAAVMEEFGEAVTDKDAPPLEEKKKLNLTQRVMKMTISEKIKLATLGNKEARTILLRDPNKLVSLAAINSPRITDGEILSMANSKTCPDEVLRTIMQNREWTKMYQVKMALVKNPKVPVAIALKFLSTLRDSEVKDLAGNKNISSVVRLQAKKMIDKKNAPVKEEK